MDNTDMKSATGLDVGGSTLKPVELKSISISVGNLPLEFPPIDQQNAGRCSSEVWIKPGFSNTETKNQTDRRTDSKTDIEQKKYVCEKIKDADNVSLAFVETAEVDAMLTHSQDEAGTGDDVDTVKRGVAPTIASLAVGFVFVTSLVIVTGLTLGIMSSDIIKPMLELDTMIKELNKRYSRIKTSPVMMWKDKPSSSDASHSPALSTIQVILPQDYTHWLPVSGQQVWIWQKGCPVEVYHMKSDRNYTTTVLADITEYPYGNNVIDVTLPSWLWIKVLPCPYKKYAFITMVSNKDIIHGLQCAINETDLGSQFEIRLTHCLPGTKIPTTL